MRLRHKFVNYIPKQLDDSVLYVAINFGTVVHRCACGCGEVVVTPLGPAEWKLIYDGRTVSLAPSIGNWSFPCKSHYWIDGGSIRWARQFSKVEVVQMRQEAKTQRKDYYQKKNELSRGMSGRDARREPRRLIWKVTRALVRAWRRGRE